MSAYKFVSSINLLSIAIVKMSYISLRDCNGYNVQERKMFMLIFLFVMSYAISFSGSNHKLGVILFLVHPLFLY